MWRLISAMGGVSIAVVGLLLIDAAVPAPFVAVGEPASPRREGQAGQTPEERIREAQHRSENVKGVYMTSVVANDAGRSAVKLRDGILALVHETEVNAVVIDVKEAAGGLIITDALRRLVAELHRSGAWAIARLVVFRDSSREQSHPAWYLRHADGKLWRDRRGGSWLDPASRDVWAYQVGAARAASDAGFDEIQFDYIRFPSDGDVQNIAYPVYDGKRPKYEVLREFFAYLSGELKRYRPELILSADLFGYVALERADLGIGQRLEDIADSFDYVSLMMYPSHYYSGFEVPADPSRNLGALSFPYQATSVANVVSNRPYEVVFRSLLIASDILVGRFGTSSAPRAGGATSSPSAPAATPSRFSIAKLRPWLQDFNLAVDSSRGIRYDAAKVRAQIEAAEAAGSSGWLLWSPDNVYTEEALQPVRAERLP